MKLTSATANGRTRLQLISVLAGHGWIDAIYPVVGPDPTEWLELDDGERVGVVRQYHKRARERAGNPELHAIIHVTVENQLAEGHPDVKAAFERLSREGLDRHNVVHAIGSVLADEIYGVMKSHQPHDPKEYARKLKELTAEAWLRGPEE